MVRRSIPELLEVFLLETFNRNLMGCAVGYRIYSRQPFLKLGVEISEGSKIASHEEVLLYESHSPFYFPLGLGSIGTAKPGNESVVLEEVLVMRIPGGIR